MFDKVYNATLARADLHLKTGKLVNLQDSLRKGEGVGGGQNIIFTSRPLPSIDQRTDRKKLLGTKKITPNS